jgi:hypothetical protein
MNLGLRQRPAAGLRDAGVQQTAVLRTLLAVASLEKDLREKARSDKDAHSRTSLQELFLVSEGKRMIGRAQLYCRAKFWAGVFARSGGLARSERPEVAQGASAS